MYKLCTNLCVTNKTKIMEKTIKSVGLNYGIYLGLFMIVIAVLRYVISIDSFLNWKLNVLLAVITIVVAIMASVKARKLLGGYISFKDAFIPFFIVSVVSLGIGLILGILLFTVIDPEAAQYLNEQTIEMTRAMLERFGAPEDAIDEAMIKAEKTDNFSIANQVKSGVFQVAFMCVIGLIVAAIVKRKDPSEA